MKKTILKWLRECDLCTVTKPMEKKEEIEKEKCNSCKDSRKLADFIEKITILYLSVGFCVFMGFISLIFPNSVVFSLFVTSFGSIFLAFKYTLDQASYHKDLFEKRFGVFKVIAEVLRGSGMGHEEITIEMENKVTNIVDESFFLFSNDTYQFIKEIQKEISNLRFYGYPEFRNLEALNKARDSLKSLATDENLLKKFPELKIDFY